MSAFFYFKLVAKHSGKCLEIANSSRDDGAPALQYVWHGGDNQRWELRPYDLANKDLRLVNKLSDKCLDTNGRSDGGAPIVQKEWVNSLNQVWHFEPVEDDPGYYYIQSKASGLYLDVRGISQDNGAPIIQWEKTRGGNQQWQLVVVEILFAPE